jgi:hypothetical protein
MCNLDSFIAHVYLVFVLAMKADQHCRYAYVHPSRVFPYDRQAIDNFQDIRRYSSPTMNIQSSLLDSDCLGRKYGRV